MSLRERLILWWGQLHIGERIRNHVVRRIVLRVCPREARVLDAGCGRGDNALWIARRRADAVVHAIDMDPQLVALIERRARALGISNLTSAVADITTIEADRRYGMVYAVDVLEHVHAPDDALRRLGATLADDGWLAIHVPQRDQRRWFSRFRTYEQDDHAREGFSLRELCGFVEASGCRVTDIRQTFGPPGALAWELFHLLQEIGRPLVLLAYPSLWTLAVMDGWFRWRHGNGLLIVARRMER